MRFTRKTSALAALLTMMVISFSAFPMKERMKCLPACISLPDYVCSGCPWTNGTRCEATPGP